jgi:hypothetical protein
MEKEVTAAMEKEVTAAVEKETTAAMEKEATAAVEKESSVATEKETTAAMDKEAIAAAELGVKELVPYLSPTSNGNSSSEDESSSSSEGSYHSPEDPFPREPRKKRTLSDDDADYNPTGEKVCNCVRDKQGEHIPLVKGKFLNICIPCLVDSFEAGPRPSIVCR